MRWDEQPRPGHFWCEDLAQVRQWLLCSGRNPKVALKSMVDISSLSYFCTARKDGAEGTCKIRQLPSEADSIRRWLAKLLISVGLGATVGLGFVTWVMYRQAV